MEIILNKVEYTAPTPVVGLWFAVQKLNTEQEKRVVEITKMWDEVKPFEGKKNMDEQSVCKLEKSMAYLSQKTEENKRILLESRIKIIVDVFDNNEVTNETILKYLPLKDVALEYAKIDNWLNDIVIGRTAQLPND